MDPSKLFSKIVRDALKHYHDPAWLGQHSPLATPYFLGRILLERLDQPASTTTCGQVLSSLFIEAAQKLWQDDLPIRRKTLLDIVAEKRAVMGNKGEHYYFLLLELRYFRRYFSKFDRPFDTRGIAEFLDISETRYFKHTGLAVDALIVELLKLVRPTFRLEQPCLHRPIFGRNTLIQTILKQLHNNQAVTINGMGGAGKTTVGTAIYTQWKTTPTFWYTFRTPLNDQYNSLLFSLAHFLHQQGRSALWLQLMVDGGKLRNHNQLQGYLARDLKLQPLLCFDEVDRLIITKEAWRNSEHLAILELLEMLVELTPTLLIGQRPIIDTLVQHTLTPLSLSETTQLLAQTTQDIDVAMIAQWHQFAQGNPRLLLLFAMLHANGERIEAGSVNIAGPFQRLWRRLSIAERDLLASLSVFRSPAPADAWADQQTLNSLIERQLVTKDSQDGVELLPLYRSYLYQNGLMREEQESQHEQAAMIRAQRGEYTSAASHYSKAGEPAKALAIWYPNLETEITRGFGASARAIFVSLSAKRLSRTEQKQLKIVRHRLADLMGDLDTILATATVRRENTIEDAILDNLEGHAAHLKGRSDRALASYGNALTRLTDVMGRLTMIHFRRGQVFLENRQLQDACHEAQNIFYFYKRLQAMIARRSGDFLAAEEAFLVALDSAENIPLIQQASTHEQLMFLYGQKRQMEQVEHHAKLAMDTFTTMGHQFLQWLTQSHLAAIYMQVGQYQDAIELGEEALQFFNSLNHVGTPVPSLLNTLAEAYFELGDLQCALTYAQRVLRTEERELLPYGGYTLARIHTKNKKYAFAHRVFVEALQVAKENADRFIRAYLLRERCKLYHLEGNKMKAQKDKVAATILFKQMNLEDEIDR